MWVRSPLEEMKYLFAFIFSFLRFVVEAKSAALSSTTQHAMPPEFEEKWGAEWWIEWLFDNLTSKPSIKQYSILLIDNSLAVSSWPGYSESSVSRVSRYEAVPPCSRAVSRYWCCYYKWRSPLIPTAVTCVCWKVIFFLILLILLGIRVKRFNFKA